MRRAALGMGMALCLALTWAQAIDMARAAHGADTDFRLLKLDGYYVKWGARTLGTGATVTYAFANGPRHFEDARNCSELDSFDELRLLSGISRETLRSETAAAFRMWERVAEITFVAIDDPYRADILIGAQGRPARRAEANVTQQPGGTNGVKAIDSALVCLNPKHRWKVGFDGDTEVYDLRYTLVHEIGHAIGLDHPGPSGQLMAFRYEEAYRELQPGDIRGAQTLYGSRRESRPTAERRFDRAAALTRAISERAPHIEGTAGTNAGRVQE